MFLFIVFLIILIYFFSLNPALGIVAIVAFILLMVITVQNSEEENKTRNQLAEKNRDKIKRKLEEISFNESKEIYLTLDSISPKMKIDTKNKQIAICNYYTNELKIIPYQNIIECQIVEDGATVLSGGVGRAIVGGVLAGGAGAIVGAATRKSKSVTNSLSLKIVTSDVNESLIVIPILESHTNRDSEKYKEAWQVAQTVYATLLGITKTVKQITPNQISTNPLAQIEMLSKLKNQGAITEEEYNQKKQELLSKV